MAQHNWEIDTKEVMRAMAHDMIVEKCTHCGCIKITMNASDFLGRKVVYKAPQFTWNPFKTLATEPSCPAQW